MCIGQNIFFENWKYWMALEVIESLLVHYPVSVQADIIAAQLIPKDKIAYISKSIPTYFQDKLQRIKISTQFIKELQLEINRHYLDNAKKEIAVAFKKLKSKSTFDFIESLSDIIKTASPLNISHLLEDLVSAIEHQILDYENLQISIFKKKDSLQSSLHKLLKNDSQRHNIMAISKAISLIYEAKINSEINQQYIFYFNSLRVITQSYLDSINRTVDKLQRVSESIRSKCTLSIISLPVFSLLDRVDIDKQKMLLEIWSGHSINCFGNSIISYQQIESKLIKNLHFDISNLSRDFELMYEEHFVFNSKINQKLD